MKKFKEARFALNQSSSIIVNQVLKFRISAKNCSNHSWGKIDKGMGRVVEFFYRRIW